MSRNSKKEPLAALVSSSSEVVGQCLSAAEMAELVDMRCEQEQKDTYLDHIGTCDTCYREWITLRSQEINDRRRYGNAFITILRKKSSLAIIGTAMAVAVFLQLKTAPININQEQILRESQEEMSSPAAMQQMPQQRNTNEEKTKEHIFSLPSSDQAYEIPGNNDGQSTTRDNIPQKNVPLPARPAVKEYQNGSEAQRKKKQESLLQIPEDKRTLQTQRESVPSPSSLGNNVRPGDASFSGDIDQAAKQSSDQPVDNDTPVRESKKALLEGAQQLPKESPPLSDVERSRVNTVVTKELDIVKMIDAGCSKKEDSTRYWQNIASYLDNGRSSLKKTILDSFTAQQVTALVGKLAGGSGLEQTCSQLQKLLKEINEKNEVK